MLEPVKELVIIAAPPEVTDLPIAPTIRPEPLRIEVETLVHLMVA